MVQNFMAQGRLFTGVFSSTSYLLGGGGINPVLALYAFWGCPQQNDITRATWYIVRNKTSPYNLIYKAQVQKMPYTHSDDNRIHLAHLGTLCHP